MPVCGRNTAGIMFRYLVCVVRSSSVWCDPFQRDSLRIILCEPLDGTYNAIQGWLIVSIWDSINVEKLIFLAVRGFVFLSRKCTPYFHTRNGALGMHSVPESKSLCALPM